MREISDRPSSNRQSGLKYSNLLLTLWLYTFLILKYNSLFCRRLTQVSSFSLFLWNTAGTTSRQNENRNLATCSSKFELKAAAVLASSTLSINIRKSQPQHCRVVIERISGLTVRSQNYQKCLAGMIFFLIYDSWVAFDYSTSPRSPPCAILSLARGIISRS